MNKIRFLFDCVLGIISNYDDEWDTFTEVLRSFKQGQVIEGNIVDEGDVVTLELTEGEIAVEVDKTLVEQINIEEEQERLARIDSDFTQIQQPEQ